MPCLEIAEGPGVVSVPRVEESESDLIRNQLNQREKRSGGRPDRACSAEQFVLEHRTETVYRNRERSRRCRRLRKAVNKSVGPELR
jgi:hypothetical protein